MDFDLIIVGGGLAGLSLAAALRSTPLTMALVEGKPPRAPEGWDARIYAVSPANARFLQEIGVWQHLDPARMMPVARMEVAGDGGGRLDLSAYDSGVGELAWILESFLMQQELWETVKRQGNARLFCPGRPAALALNPDHAELTLEGGERLRGRLVVAADGADSWTRSAAGIEVDFKHYGHHGVVANFATEGAHHGTAWQWFRDDGVLAWLPLPGQRMSMVWSTPEATARELVALDAESLCARVAQAGGHRLGKLGLLTPAVGFPLRLMRAPRTVGPRLALIGDAAHAIHPLSGHGINLGFQDARVLAQVLAEKPDHVDAGDERWLRRYERARAEEVIALQSVTDGLQRLFQSGNPAVAALRNIGLDLTNVMSPLKDRLIRYAMG